jgi:ribosome recycling factor
MSLSRLALCTRPLLRARLSRPLPAAIPPHVRTYAVKNKNKGKSTADLKPGSKFKLQDEAAIQEYQKAEKIMQTSVEWYRKECALLEQRATGRVTPSLLNSVHVKISGSDVPLEKVAAVGVREGTTLLITAMEEAVRRVSCSK